MPSQPSARLTPLPGLAGMACWIAAYPFGLDVPGIGTGADAVGTYVAGHRASLAVFAVLVSVGAALVIAFLGGLKHDADLGRAELRPVLDIGWGAGIATQTLVVAGTAALLGAAVAPSSVPVAATLVTAFQVLFVMSAWPTVVTNAAYGAVQVRAAARVRWVGWLSLLAAAVHVPAGLAVASSGFWAAPGFFGDVAPAVFMLWVIGTSVALIRTSRAQVHEAASAPSTV